MNKYVFLPFIPFIIFTLSIVAYAQWLDFPTGYDAVPKSKLKGPVHIVLTIEQRGEKVFKTFVEVFDKNGKLIEEMNSNAGIEVHSQSMVRLGGKKILNYDAQGRLLNQKYFTLEGKLTGYQTYAFDEKNRLIKNIYYGDDGKEFSNTTYTYLPEKREVVIVWNIYVRGKLIPSKTVLFYNEKDQWIKRIRYDSNETTDEYVSFEYDTQGNFVNEVNCCKYNFSHRYSYKFDKEDNWIERQNTYVQLGKDGKEEINPEWMRTYRVITYYSDSETKP